MRPALIKCGWVAFWAVAWTCDVIAGADGAFLAYAKEVREGRP